MLQLAHWAAEKGWWRWAIHVRVHGNRLDAMRSVDHATGHRFALLVVGLLSVSICYLGHVLKVDEHVIGVCVCRRLHHGHLFFIDCAFPMNWTRSH